MSSWWQYFPNFNHANFLWIHWSFRFSWKQILSLSNTVTLVPSLYCFDWWWDYKSCYSPSFDKNLCRAWHACSEEFFHLIHNYSHKSLLGKIHFTPFQSTFLLYLNQQKKNFWLQNMEKFHVNQWYSPWNHQKF